MHLGDHFWNGVEKLVYFILFPALLVNAIVKTRLDLGAALPLLATAFAAMAGGMLLGLLPKLFSAAAGADLCLDVPVRLPLQFLHRAGGGRHAVRRAGHCHHGADRRRRRAASPTWCRSGCWPATARSACGGRWRAIRLIWGTASGFLLNLAGFVPPAPVQAFLGRLADASIALGLITVGAALRLDGSSGVRGFSPAGCWRSSCSPCR
jgi:malonate transporter